MVGLHKSVQLPTHTCVGPYVFKSRYAVAVCSNLCVKSCRLKVVQRCPWSRAPSSRSFVRLRRCETGEETHSGVERRETGGGPPLVTSSFRFLAPAGSGGRRLFTCAGARALCSEERGPWCGVQERERESRPAMVLLGPQLTVSSIGGERALQPPLKERASARASCVSEGVVAGASASLVQK